MFLAADYKPEFESFTDHLLELAQIRAVDQLLKRMVTLLAERPHVAAARIWLVDEGDVCSSCNMLGRCQNRSSCLHLVASAGSRRTDRTPDWTSIHDEYQRIPLGVGKIGQVGSTGEAVVVRDLAEDPSWAQRYPWAAQENIRGFNAQPIRCKDKILGVLAVFTGIPTPDAGRDWLRIFADHIAVALTNAQAYEEIERLRAQVEIENVYLEEELREAKAFGDIIGHNVLMQKLMRQLEMVAPTDATVLILGESGTGKELVAREIHRRSRRRDHPLIRVNCASVPRELYESEFFGHVKGAFTGAIKDRSGRFEAANGGTLFLDEVGEIPLELQSKFLRVLQERQYERVGEERTRKVDVRIVAATNRDLKKEVEEGRFRQDLYYRLNVFPLEVPPLRDRKDDIPSLTAHFLEQAAQRLRLPLPRFTEAHARLLQSYDWPGNVRELQNAVERALILAQNASLQFDVPLNDLASGRINTDAVSGPQSDASVILTDVELRQLEVRNTLAALTKSAWKIHGEGGAAELLGVKPTTLISRIKKLNLKKPD
ncbi:MAG TPA: sigma 54-interacting transcriptional regulator [Candidatus Paceibacterota bacterium]|nr:sigma 54-interacting transcriptional regulator [Verrucomicrobiota bacterium]HRY46562.1 sigma 54-interacting transcriptional regulator [Candidatus Paceibacterota bacterium]HSA01365.1 sigma 54-interacting transcriptional regulator [Candidatus Paceibacterota bacterium]